jgi:hypothetical protein
MGALDGWLASNVKLEERPYSSEISGRSRLLEAAFGVSFVTLPFFVFLFSGILNDS